MTAEDTTTERRRELARRMLAARGLAATPPESGRIPLAPRGSRLPLSSSQQRMWLHQRLNPGSAAYNLTVAVRLDGELDVTALTGAIQDVVGHHDILRTSYPPDESGSPVQVVAPSLVTPLPLTAVSEVDDQARVAAVVAAAGRLGAEAFDITTDPPLRPHLFRLEARSHVLVLVLHHIACDDDTWRVLFADLARGYRARVAGQPTRLSALPIQYGDFAAWERDRPTDGQLDYWRARLTPPPSPLEVATDPRRHPEHSEAGARRSVVVPARVRAALRGLGQRAGCTPFMVLLAGFVAMLHRYTGSDDIAVGSPVVNRDRAELRELVGNFGNTIVLRTDTSGDPTFRQLLDRVRQTCVDGYAHQELPFDRLVSELAVERVPGRNPLFGVLFSTRAEVFDEFTLPGLRTSEIDVHNGTARFDLSMQVRDTGADLLLSLVYRTDLYADGAAEAMLDHFATLLTGVAENADARLSALPLLTSAERRRILYDWNDTRRDDLAAEESLTAMVERQVARTPNAIAVISDQERLTYAELNERANRLAHHLRTLGMDRGALVGLHLHRSVDLTIAMLAVLKAGGAYLPLEPSWPAARITEVAANAKPGLVLHHPRSGVLPPSLAPTVVNLESDRARIQESPGDNPAVPVDPEDLMNVLYTSGSTGRPKGVMTPHRAIRNRLAWQREVLGMAPDDTVLHKAPPGFDVSMSEIFLPLVSGARLLVAEPDGERDPAYLLQLMNRHRATFMYLVPAMLDVLLSRDDFAHHAQSLRYVWCGGEVLTPELFARFRERFPALPLYHSYGLTETTITATCEPYTGTRQRHGTTVGRPIANARCYVLDRYLNPVPVGVTGELYVGGAPLARGYLNEPELTAARFVKDPFGADRLYRTGDLGRLRPDGTIEFLGRADHQVKIRGLRIEPEEIEAKLAPHPDVRQAAVVVRRHGTGPAQLVAYCVPESANLVDETDIRRWLAARLPDYMVPADIVFLPELPVLASGKIDRRALAELPPPRRAEPTNPSAPSEGLERRIADVWREVLGVDQVDPEGNFFDLGGDSLLLLKVQARLESELGRELTRVDLFTYTTVRSLAAHLEGSDR